MSGELGVEIHAAVTENVMTITIDRSAKKNAITAPMYDAMAEAIESGSRDSAVRCIILTGAGNCFTAGNDIKDFIDNPPSDLSAPLYRFLRALIYTPKIVIAAVEGIAAGIGTTLLLHCDLAVGGRGARFLLPFVTIGLVPEAGSSLLFPQLIGRRAAAKHLLMTDLFDAETALRYGLLSDICDDGSALSCAQSMAAAVAAKAPSAIAMTKKMIVQTDEVWAAIEKESAAYADCLRSAETSEALSAFLEKRPARFAG